MTKNSAKAILFKTVLKGKGGVNYDGNGVDTQRVHIFNHEKLSHLRHFDKSGWNLDKKLNEREMFKLENISYLKKVISEDGSYKIKISNDALIHALFKNTVIALPSTIVHNDDVLYSYLASPTALLRGHLFANKSEALKRKGSITMTDAVQTNNTLSSIELFSRSGAKTTKDADLKKSDNTYFFKETIGDVEYESEGMINLSALQFISADQKFDRASFNSDKYPLFSDYLKLTFPDFNAKLGYYQLSSASVELPEYGFVLTNSQINFLVKEFFKKLFELRIDRRASFASTTSIKYKIVYDGTVDRFNNEDGWIEIIDNTSIRNIKFETEAFYTQIDEKTAKDKIESLEERYAAQISSEKAIQETKRKAKNEKKVLVKASRKKKKR